MGIKIRVESGTWLESEGREGDREPESQRGSKRCNGHLVRRGVGWERRLEILLGKWEPGGWRENTGWKENAWCSEDIFVVGTWLPAECS